MEITRQRHVGEAPDGVHPAGPNLVLDKRNGGKQCSWIFRYRSPTDRVTDKRTGRLIGKMKVIGVGSAHPGHVTLDEARAKAYGYRQQVREGKDPQQVRDDARKAVLEAAGLTMTVNDLISKFVERKLTGLASVTRKAHLGRLAHIAKIFGRLPVGHVTRAMILDNPKDGKPGFGLAEMWATQTPKAVQYQNLLDRLFRMAEGLEKNPAAWRGNLENELRKASEVHRPQSHPYVRYQDLGQFMDRLRHYVDGSCRKRGHTNASLALEFVVLTAARPDEVLRARWKEIDWHNNIWNKSWDHRKNRHKLPGEAPHRVPITKPMMDVLTEMRRRHQDVRDDDLIFPSDHGQNIKMAVGTLQRLNVSLWPEKRTHVHGFRSTLKGWCKHHKYPMHLWEEQADHMEQGGKAQKAYDHADDHLDDRRRMMEAYGVFAGRTKADAGKIVEFNRMAK